MDNGRNGPRRHPGGAHTQPGRGGRTGAHRAAPQVVTPPITWMADDARQDCSQCRVVYTLITRRHHCRSCGALVCGACTSHTLMLLEHRESATAPKKVVKVSAKRARARQ